MDRSRIQRRNALVAAGGLLILVAVAVGAALLINQWTRPSDSSLQQQVLAIAAELHAPGDQNTMTAATSSLTLAQHMRYQIQQYLLQGKTSAQILHLMVQTYGSGVLAAPAFHGLGRLVWIAPWVLLVGSLLLGVWLLYRGLRQSKQMAQESTTGTDGPDLQTAVDESMQETLRERLREYY